MKKTLSIIAVLILLVGSGVLCFFYYPYIFSKNVMGKLQGVERVSQPEAIIGNSVRSEYVFSYAVSIKDDKNEIHTGSSEDRQWAVAQEGQCAEAKFFPYPPWDLEKGGTYFGVRLLRLFDCPVGMQSLTTPATAPSPTATPVDSTSPDYSN